MILEYNVAFDRNKSTIDHLFNDEFSHEKKTYQIHTGCCFGTFFQIIGNVIIPTDSYFSEG